MKRHLSALTGLAVASGCWLAVSVLAEPPPQAGNQPPPQLFPPLPGAPAQAAPQPATPPPVVLPPHPVTSVQTMMPPNVLAWDAEFKEIKIKIGSPPPEFSFYFTNVSSGDVMITHVQPTCGCTTLQLPPMPWRVAAGTNGHIPVRMSLGAPGAFFKTITVHSDKGSKLLQIKAIVELPPPAPMTEDQRKRNQELVKQDPQAIFKGDCVTCHVQPAIGKFGKDLYVAACGICHEAEHRATIVPDLHKLPHDTNAEYWKAIVTGGKPGSLMPAFSQHKNGPLSDQQIQTLVDYLVATMPAKAAATNSPTASPTVPAKPAAPHAGK